MTTKKTAFKTVLAAGCAALALACGAGVASAQQASTQSFTIARQDLGSALRTFALSSGRDVVFDPELVRGKTTRGVTGELTDEEALRRLLEGSGLTFNRTASGGFVITLAAINASFSPEVATLDDVIVTANKRSERLIDVPMSVVALGAAQLEERNVTSLLDVVRLAPGLAVQDQGPGQRRIFMRGVGNAFGNSSLVGLYLDEASVNSIQDAEIDLRPYDLNRVEVLRGPQGTLYGEGATAGTVKFVSNDPDLDGFGASVKDTLSFTKGGDASNDFTGMLNVPVSDTFGFRVSGEVLNSGGWIDQPAQSRENINDQQMYDVRLVGLYRPMDELSVRFMGIVHRNDAGAQNTVSDRSNTFAQVLGQTETPSSIDEYNFANATVTYDFGAVELLSSSTYLDVTKNLFHQGASAPIAPPPATPLSTYGDRWRDAEVWSEELRLSASGDRLSWIAGAYYRESTSDYAQTLIAGFGAPMFGFSTGNTNTSKAGSLFGNIDYELTEAVTVGGGLRYFHDRRETSAAGVSQSGSFESVSPRAYIKYSLNADTNVYASVSKGFRSGGFNAAGQTNYGPETAWTYEAGAKGRDATGRFTAEISLFHTTYEDIQVYTITDFVTLASRYTNAGKVLSV